MGMAPPTGRQGRRVMHWDPLQREVLEALGHTLYTRTEREGASLADDQLLHALLRAAARSADDADAHALTRAWMPTARLRRDPAAKRALWPQLRALRAARGP